MARLSREEEAYLRGLNRALDLVKAGGQQMLEKEIEWRGQTVGFPVGILNCELKRLARKQIVPELRVVSTAIAYTLEFDMRLPSRTINKFLVGFNTRVDDYRLNAEKLREDRKELSHDYGLNEQVNKLYSMAQERDGSLPDLEEDNEDEYIE